MKKEERMRPRLVTRKVSDIGEREIPTKWGRWKLDLERLVLIDSHPSGYGYEIDIEKCTTSAEVLDWLAQMRTKTWVNTEDLGDLIVAFDDILSLQATLCSGGEDCGPIDVAAIVQKRFAGR